MNKEQLGALPADPQHLEARSDARGRSHRASHEGRGGELSRPERPRHAGIGVQSRAAHARPRAQADPQDRRSDQAHRRRHATVTASRPAKRSASSGSKRARSRPCASRRRSAANVGKSSTVTETTATARSTPRNRAGTELRPRQWSDSADPAISRSFRSLSHRPAALRVARRSDCQLSRCAPRRRRLAAENRRSRSAARSARQRRADRRDARGARLPVE